MNLEQLSAIAAQTKAEAKSHHQRIHVCMAASCQSSGATEVLSELSDLADKDAGKRVCVKGVGCMGLCSCGPLVSVSNTDTSSEVMYQKVQPTDAAAVYGSANGGQAVEKLRCSTDVPFFSHQHKIVLENSGTIDPEKIEDYIAAGGYQALVKAITELTPDDVLLEVNESGLRGRGGGGYPSGIEVDDRGQVAGSGEVRHLQRR